MLLLDEILRYEAQGLCAAVRVRPEKLFCDERGAFGWVGLEWMAQAAGAWAGAQQLDSGERVDIGFLLGTRCYRGPDRFAPGTWYATVDVVLFDGEAGMAVMDATVSSSPTGDTPCASSRIKVFQPPDAADFIRSQRAVQA
jgi:predicted hotdog family 3-hydroxylacyl-ACP dehydratase